MKLNVNNENYINIYLRGSRLFGTANEKSDYDYIVVVKDFTDYPLTAEDGNESYAFVTKSAWERMARKNQIEIFEALFAPKEFKIKETYVPNFEFNYEYIRRNFSKQASNSWVKCKKKLTLPNEDKYIGRKSMWHSLRLLMEEAQLLKYGKIDDFQCANKYYGDIVNTDKTWEELKEKYQPIYNELHSICKSLFQLH